MQITPEGEESIQLLSSLANVDTDTARRVFLKHNGDMNKTAEALLGGDTGKEEWNQRTNTPEPGFFDSTTGPPIQVTPAPNGSTIDLTEETDSYQTAPGSHFGPSNRAPDPNWQMVPSNLAVTSTPGISQDDQTLNDAIQASLNDFASEEKDDPFPLINNVREGGRPVAIRPESPSLSCAALVVQALFHVPQVRSAVGHLRLPDITPDVAHNHPARVVLSLIELFTNIDLAQLSTIVDAIVLPNLENDQDREMADHPSERAAAMVNRLGQTLEAHLSAQQEDDSAVNLFEFTHLNVELANRLPRKVGRQTKGGVVKIDHGGPGGENDLISQLSTVLSRYEEGKSSHDVIVEPSQMLAFNLMRHPSTTNNGQKKEPVPFAFPKSFFLDKFMFRNLELANRKRVQQQDYTWEIQDLMNQREALTRFNQRDTIEDLRNSIYYYENVAFTAGDQARQQTVKHMLNQLKDILTMVESKVQGISRRIQELEKLSEGIFNVPELQQFQYDLRAVLMHTGLPGNGRKQMYSYVQDAEGVWWKTCDYEVTEVTDETVLSDATGLHLSAGPFLLLYSRHMSDEQLCRPIQWPKVFADEVEDNNQKFFAILPPEVASKAKKQRSLPTPLPTTPSGRTAHHLQAPPRSGSMGPRPANRSNAKTLDTMSVD